MNTPTATPTVSKSVLGKVILTYESGTGHVFAVHRLCPDLAAEQKFLLRELEKVRLKAEEVYMKFNKLEEVPKPLEACFFWELHRRENCHHRHLMICRNGTTDLYVAEVGIDKDQKLKVFRTEPLELYVINPVAAGLITVTKRPRGK